MAVRINLNEKVKFKLSERGKEIYRHRYDGYGIEYNREPELDDDGYMEMQLWVFMQTFGEHMTMAMPEVLKPLEIIYEQNAESATTTDCISRAEQVTSKLKNPDDSLLTDDLEACKEQKSKLDCISRADAIAYIDRITNSGLGKNKSLDYLRKYISALPSAETHEIRTETHGVCLDCISRADLPKKLNGVVLDDCDKIVDEFLAEHECDELWNVVRALRDFYDWTIDAPSVTPTERTGEWVNSKGEPVDDSYSVYCSRCKAWSEYRDIYCGNCGAKMGGDTE